MTKSIEMRALLAVDDGMLHGLTLIADTPAARELLDMLMRGVVGGLPYCEQVGMMVTGTGIVEEKATCYSIRLIPPH